MILDVLLTIVLIICFITDFKQQKIYNVVIFPSLILALIINFVFSGYNGILFSITGFLVGFAVLLIPHLLGGIGAGDVKLLALIGAIKGTNFVINTSLYMALIGGLMAIIVIVIHKKNLNSMKSFLVKFSFMIKYNTEKPTSSFLVKFPYGIAIVLGAFICLFFRGGWVI